jgi:hypothetical protein
MRAGATPGEFTVWAFTSSRRLHAFKVALPRTLLVNRASPFGEAEALRGLAEGVALRSEVEGKVAEIARLEASLGALTAVHERVCAQNIALLADLEAAAPWFSAGAFRSLMIDSCDAFDAALAAFSSRAAALGQYLAPTAEQLEQARVEGWIALPNEAVGAIGTFR